jgi:hypothetical protein
LPVFQEEKRREKEMKFELKYFSMKKKKKVRDISMTHCHWDFKVQMNVLELYDLHLMLATIITLSKNYILLNHLFSLAFFFLTFSSLKKQKLRHLEPDSKHHRLLFSSFYQPVLYLFFFIYRYWASNTTPYFQFTKTSFN